MDKKVLPKVSIIIPVYNVEKYLEQCLKSVALQTYDNIECILIIDGATDNSYYIAKEFCKLDSRFTVFYQENAGSGPARNNGIVHSTGEFICFIDPDDWVEPNYVESLVSEQEKGDFDLVISQTVDVRINADDKIIDKIENTKPIISYLSISDCRENFPALMFGLHYLDGPICKLFKKSIIIDNRIEFPAYRRSQDMVFNFRYYNHIQTLSTIGNHTYYIRYEYPPRPGRGRVFTGYENIIANIYWELSIMLAKWNIAADYDALFHSWSFWYVCAHIYQCVQSGISYEYVKDEPFKTIINRSKPALKSHRMIRQCILWNQYHAATSFVRFMNWFRMKKLRQ